jgi:hypothetical protein
MRTHRIAVWLLAGLLVGSGARAQVVAPPPYHAHGHAAHVRGGAAGPRGWLPFGRARGAAAGNGSGGFDAGGTAGLPRGRRYYNGRYFGGFNNRFYSPQYGYF